MNGTERWKLHGRAGPEVRARESSYERFTEWRVIACQGLRASLRPGADRAPHAPLHPPACESESQLKSPLGNTEWRCRRTVPADWSNLDWKWRCSAAPASMRDFETTRTRRSGRRSFQMH